MRDAGLTQHVATRFPLTTGFLSLLDGGYDFPQGSLSGTFAEQLTYPYCELSYELLYADWCKEQLWQCELAVIQGAE